MKLLRPEHFVGLSLLAVTLAASTQAAAEKDLPAAPTAFSAPGKPARLLWMRSRPTVHLTDFARRKQAAKRSTNDSSVNPLAFPSASEKPTLSSLLPAAVVAEADLSASPVSVSTEHRSLEAGGAFDSLLMEQSAPLKAPSLAIDIIPIVKDAEDAISVPIGPVMEKPAISDSEKALAQRVASMRKPPLPLVVPAVAQKTVPIVDLTGGKKAFQPVVLDKDSYLAASVKSLGNQFLNPTAGAPAPPKPQPVSPVAKAPLAPPPVQLAWAGAPENAPSPVASPVAPTPVPQANTAAHAVQSLWGGGRTIAAPLPAPVRSSSSPDSSAFQKARLGGTNESTVRTSSAFAKASLNGSLDAAEKQAIFDARWPSATPSASQAKMGTWQEASLHQAKPEPVTATAVVPEKKADIAPKADSLVKTIEGAVLKTERPTDDAWKPVGVAQKTPAFVASRNMKDRVDAQATAWVESGLGTDDKKEEIAAPSPLEPGMSRPLSPLSADGKTRRAPVISWGETGRAAEAPARFSLPRIFKTSADAGTQLAALPSDERARKEALRQIEAETKQQTGAPAPRASYRPLPGKAGVSVASQPGMEPKSGKQDLVQLAQLFDVEEEAAPPKKEPLLKPMAPPVQADSLFDLDTEEMPADSSDVDMPTSDEESGFFDKVKSFFGGPSGEEAPALGDDTDAEMPSISEDAPLFEPTDKIVLDEQGDISLEKVTSPIGDVKKDVLGKIKDTFKKARHKVRVAQEEPSYLPTELRILFKEDEAAISGKTLKWVRAMAKRAKQDTRTIIHVRIPRVQQDLQARRYALIRGILMSMGVKAQRLDPVLTNQSGDIFLLRVALPKARR